VNDMRPPSFTAEELLALCRPSGVGRVNLIQMSFYVGQGVSGKMDYEIARQHRALKPSRHFSLFETRL